ncbi:NAD(P)/FAD-dependent oxidoreductase [Alkalibacillus aidingensis]|uniref:NAD(P)/FAD-dependent oxidoreductase n=1 Tax=Alkalibacillus aidingensis TaxID=2747607 RepID=UPI0016612B28|nr:FAD-binding oxidoreductase [Alkalibacillus aidingensis]
MTQYIVIGAGILGASTAYHLAKAGQQVLLIDKKDQGEATRATAGIISPWLSQKRNAKLYEVVKQGAKYYPELVDELKKIGETETTYAQVGSLHLQKNENKIDKMVADVVSRRESAPEIGEVTKLSDQEVEQATPVMSDRMGAVRIGGGARVNGGVFCNALIRAAQHHGAEVIEGEAQLEKSQPTAVTVNGTTYTGKKIIMTTGAWAEKLLKDVGVTFPVESKKTQILYLHMPDEKTADWPVVMLPNNKYIVGFEDGVIAVGAEHEPNEDFQPTVKSRSIHDILKIVFKFAPGLTESNFIESRVGFRPATEHLHPVFGELPDRPDIFIANGLGASGITSGPFLGAEIANLLLGDNMELNPNDYDFGSGVS